MHVFAYILLLLVETAVLFVVAAYGVALVYSSFAGAPYVPTSSKRIADILAWAKLKKKSTFIELGSGDGRIVRMAVAKYGVQGIGIDINPALTFLARIIARHHKLSGISFLTQNVFASELSQADTIYLFLMPQLITKLIPKFKKELKKGTLIISHGFKLEGWNLPILHKIETEPFSTYFYRV